MKMLNAEKADRHRKAISNEFHRFGVSLVTRMLLDWLDTQRKGVLLSEGTRAFWTVACMYLGMLYTHKVRCNLDEVENELKYQNADLFGVCQVLEKKIPSITPNNEFLWSTKNYRSASEVQLNSRLARMSYIGRHKNANFVLRALKKWWNCPG